jgi:osmotically-inducible protein OsmY
MILNRAILNYRLNEQFLFGRSLFRRILIVGLVFGLFSVSILTGCTSQKNTSPVFSQSSDPDTPRSISTQFEDVLICARINRKMISDDLVKSKSIDVDVYNGIAYLKGSVENQSQKRMAADLTRGVEGVIRVKNLLVVKRTIP